MDFEKIKAEKSPLIDKEIERAFPKQGIENLHPAIWYHMDTGGKKIRPLLAIMTCEALGGNSEKIIPFAAACEIMHNWFLIHDDIEDGDVIRRDKPAVWIKYGLAHGINIGDYMAHKVFEMILNSDVDEKIIFKLVKAASETVVKTGEGQTMDINMRENGNPSEKDYMEMVLCKTGHYLTLPMVGGAIVAGANQKIIDKIIEFGHYIGPAFQITDDILDLTEGKGRGEIGRDIKEGKRSFLVVHCVSKCNKAEKTKLLKILKKNPKKTTDGDVLWVKDLFEKYGSILYAKEKTEELSSQAKEIIKEMPSEFAEVLNYFADYLIKRKK